MSPATIAIIPLVAAVTASLIGWFRAAREDGANEEAALGWAVIFTLFGLIAAFGFAYFAGVVYFNSWSF